MVYALVSVVLGQLDLSSTMPYQPGIYNPDSSDRSRAYGISPVCGPVLMAGMGEESRDWCFAAASPRLASIAL